MRLTIERAAVLVALIVLALAAWVIRGPIMDAIEGRTPPGTPAPAPGSAAPPARVRFETVAAGFAGPVDLQFIPGSARDAIVLEKAGRARLVQLPEPTAPVAAAGAPIAAGAAPVVAAPGADVFTVNVHAESELGLLGLAFHPRYAENGLFYLNTNPNEDGPLRTRISEWRWRPEMSGKELAKQQRVLLEIEQPYKNHDGGQLVFGPDGYLYIGMGDGGSRADPQRHGQNLQSLLGKMLRIDVNAPTGYGIPPDNPFVNRPGARPEIWAYGLRNPWRFSFDPKGRLIAADVGQDLFEEVDIVSAGANMGWNVREAAHCFEPKRDCPKGDMVDPVFEYGRDAGQSITGGHVYQGEAVPWLRGKYLVGDFVTGRVWALTLPDEASGTAHAEELGVFQHAFSAFARAPNGELYALDFARGLILAILPA